MQHQRNGSRCNSEYAERSSTVVRLANSTADDRVAIGAYLGNNDSFDQAVAEFAVAYADQNQCDYQALVDAVKAKRVKAQTGV